MRFLGLPFARQILCAFVVLASIAQVPAYAQNSCKDVVDQPLKYRNHRKIEFGYDDVILNTSWPMRKVTTVKMKRQLREGGAIYRVTKNRDFKGWGAFYSTSGSDFAVDANPLWPIYILQKRTAAYLGIQQTSANVILAPDAILLNRRLDNLDVLLKKQGHAPTFARHYTLEEANIEKKKYSGYTEMYVSRFVDKALMPISEKEFVHDIAAHTLNFLITEKQMGPIRARGRALLRFVEAIRKNNGERLSPILKTAEAREVAVQALLRTFSMEIDNFSGQISQALGAHFLGDKPTARERYNTFILYGLSYMGGIHAAKQQEVQNVNSAFPDNPTMKQWIYAINKALAYHLSYLKSDPYNKGRGVLYLMEKNQELLYEIAANSKALESDLNKILEQLTKETGFYNQLMFYVESNADTGLTEMTARLSEIQRTLNSSVNWENEKDQP